MDNKFRRRCRKCGKRVSLRVIRHLHRTVIKCPNCFAEGQFVPQERYEKRKK